MRRSFGVNQEPFEPLSELLCRENSSHQVGFVERCGEEVLSRGFVLGRIISIAQVILSGSIHDCLFELLVSDSACIVEYLAECEGRIGVDTGSDGSGQSGQVAQDKGDDFALKGFKNFTPLLSLGIVPGVQFGLESQEPCPTVHPFEGSIFFCLEVGDFGIDIGLGKVLSESLSGRLCEGVVGVGFQKSHEHPVTMDTAVPIEAPVEGRVELLGAKHILGSYQNIGGFVGIFAAEPVDCKFCKVGSLGIVDSNRCVLAQANAARSHYGKPKSKQLGDTFQRG